MQLVPYCIVEEDRLAIGSVTRYGKYTSNTFVKLDETRYEEYNPKPNCYSNLNLNFYNTYSIYSWAAEAPLLGYPANNRCAQQQPVTLSS